jgi:hypothetical protein
MAMNDELKARSGGGAHGVSGRKPRKRAWKPFNGVLKLDAAEDARFEECMTNPGEPTEAMYKAAELLRKLYG